jgi:hypothetical protein
VTPAALDDALASRVAAAPFPPLRLLPLGSLGPLDVDASDRESSTTAPRRGGAIAREAREEKKLEPVKHEASGLE